MRSSSLEQEGTNQRGQEHSMNTQEAGRSRAGEEQQRGKLGGAVTSGHETEWVKENGGHIELR